MKLRLRAAIAAERDYREDARELAAIAVDCKAAGADREAREARIFAFVAVNAARVEVFDPEPPDAPWCSCPTCRAYIDGQRTRQAQEAFWGPFIRALRGEA